MAESDWFPDKPGACIPLRSQEMSILEWEQVPGSELLPCLLGQLFCLSIYSSNASVHVGGI